MYLRQHNFNELVRDINNYFLLSCQFPPAKKDLPERKKMIGMLLREWPELSEKTAKQLSKAVFGTMAAIIKIDNNFPKGIINFRRCLKANKLRFHKKTIQSAIVIINEKRSSNGNGNVYAFPKMPNFLQQKTA